MKAKLSVIIASYNHQDYIAQTLESLEKQTFTDFEIILIDDGSTDRTVEVARSCPSRAQIFTQENLGVVAARNRGIKLAQGKYLCFVDSDDLVLTERFTRQVAALDADPELGLVFADAVIIDSTDRQLGRFSDTCPVVAGNVAEMLVLHYCFIPMITVMVRADILSKTGPFDAPGPISDYIKWIEVAYLSKVRYDPVALGCWRRHATSTSKSLNAEKKYAQTRTWLKKTLRKYPQLQAAVGKKIMKRFSRSYFLTAFSLAADGNIKRARKYYCKAVKVYPWAFASWIGLVVTVITPGSLAAKLHRHIRSKRLPW